MPLQASRGGELALKLTERQDSAAVCPCQQFVHIGCCLEGRTGAQLQVKAGTAREQQVWMALSSPEAP